jgi:hypothetical protein
MSGFEHCLRVDNPVPSVRDRGVSHVWLFPRTGLYQIGRFPVYSGRLTMTKRLVTVLIQSQIGLVWSHGKQEHMGSVERTRELRRRRSRKVKLKKLRTRFAKAANETEKATILAQARRVSPLVSFEE